MAGPKPPPKKSGVNSGATPSTVLPKPQGADPSALQAPKSLGGGPKPPPKGSPASVKPAVPATPTVPNSAAPIAVKSAVSKPLVGKPAAPASKPISGAQPLRPIQARKPLGGLGTAAKAKAVSIDDDVPVENRVFAISGLKDTRMPAVFSDFQEKIVPKIRVAETSRAILEAFSNIDVNSEKVAQTLRNNPYYESLFLRYVQGLGKVADGIKLEAAIVLLGMQNSRNLVLALQTIRTVKGAHPTFDKDGKLAIAPNEILKYALKTEEILAGKKDSYADTAYAAGLVFDILALLAGELASDPKKVLSFIETTYLHGLKTAHIGVELGKSVPDFGFSKYVFSTCLLHDIGKIALAILEPNYLPFIEECSKRELSRAGRLFAENRRFGVNHAVLGGLSFEQFQMFKSVSKAILFHHEPYLLGTGKKGVGQLANLISVATNIANNFKKTDKIEDPILKNWKTLESKNFPLDLRAMMKATSRVVG